MSVKPWLLLPAKVAHDVSPWFLNAMAPMRRGPIPEWQSFDWKGLHFPNRLGISGGVDKNASTVEAWWSFGAGFVEVGTVTPRPQKANPGKIIDRDVAHIALWNKMGFPNRGADSVEARLKRIAGRHRSPVLLNIGKNRDTGLETAWQDYALLLKRFNGVADAFVINISSPNTQGLRDLLDERFLSSFLENTLREKPAAPVLLKLSPDLTEAALKSALDVSLSFGVDGWILTNTTRERAPRLKFPVEGGVSGLPLAVRSRECLKLAVKHLGSKKEGKLLVSSGGVLSADDVMERLKIGADLVQVYTALVFHGPWFFDRVAQQIASRLH